MVERMPTGYTVEMPKRVECGMNDTMTRTGHRTRSLPDAMEAYELPMAPAPCAEATVRSTP